MYSPRVLRYRRWTSSRVSWWLNSMHRKAPANIWARGRRWSTLRDTMWACTMRERRHPPSRYILFDFFFASPARTTLWDNWHFRAHGQSRVSSCGRFLWVYFCFNNAKKRYSGGWTHKLAVIALSKKQLRTSHDCIAPASLIFLCVIGCIVCLWCCRWRASAVIVILAHSLRLFSCSFKLSSTAWWHAEHLGRSLFCFFLAPILERKKESRGRNDLRARTMRSTWSIKDAGDVSRKEENTFHRVLKVVTIWTVL